MNRIPEQRDDADREWLKRMFEQAPGFMAILRGPDHVYELVNPAYERMIRKTGFIGKPVREVLPEIEAQGLLDLLDKVYRRGEPHRADSVEVSLSRGPEGQAGRIFVDFVIQPLTDSAGTVIGLFVQGTDVTERMRAEQALSESEKRFGGLVNSSNQVLYRHNADWSEMRQLTGGGFLADTDAPDADWFDKYIHPDDQPPIRAAIDQAIRTKSPFEMEHRVIREDGSIGWTQSRSIPILDDSGDIIEWFGAASDITAQKKAEQALRASEERLRKIFEHSNDAIFLLDPERDLIREANPKACEMFGYTRDEILVTPISHFHPEDLNDFQSFIACVVEDGHGWSDQFACRAKSGEFIASEISASPIVIDDRRCLLAIVRDVTDRKAAEAALRESEERYRALLETSTSVIWTTGPEGDFVEPQPSWEAFTGQAWPDHSGAGWAEMIHPDDREHITGGWMAAVDQGVPYSGNARVWHAGTEAYRHFSVHAAPIRGSDGSITGWVGSITDTEREKQAEERLRDTARKLDAVLDQLSEGVIVADAAGRLSYVNRCAEELHGVGNLMVPPEEYSKAYHLFTEAGEPYPSEDLPLARAVLKGETVEDARWRIRRPDGTDILAIGSARPLIDDSEEQIGSILTLRDDTERKAIEDALREQGQTLESLNRIGAAIAAELDLEKVVQLVTDAGVELIGADFGAFFYNVINEAGEAYMLFTLSGAERSQFEQFGMPRNTAVFHPTFSGEEVVRSDDITCDPRYGHNAPHRGMPEGHLPVVSYLAVPVKGRSGEVLGGLFFGHREPGRFEQHHETLMVGIAGQAAIAIDNAHLYRDAQREISNRMKAEQALLLLNESLESRVAEEIDRRMQTEEALHQLQKMETVGQLSGGIAHDFNNLLQVIHGNLSLLRSAVGGEESRERRWIDNAIKGSERAARQTQRLLAFSRRQPLAPRQIDPNHMLEGMRELLGRTLGETIELKMALEPETWPIRADSNQLENALLNLVVNARDAMPDGGRMTIETRNMALDEAYASRHPGMVPGDYVLICVSDEGPGMDGETLERAIEPFFTTKEVGKGTGLGLSMVYGFVQQSGGHFSLYSELGEGTTAKIYLPRLQAADHSGDESAHPGTAADLAEPGKGELILLCEDDDEVRAFSSETLRGLGYRVVEAADGPAALDLLRSTDEVRLLFTDVVLPGGMTGADLAERAREVQPDVKLLFTTGYARSALSNRGRFDSDVEVLTKPFAVDELANRVRAILDG